MSSSSSLAGANGYQAGSAAVGGAPMGAWACLLLTISWIIVWAVAHFVVWFAWNLGRVPFFIAREPVEHYWRRLARSQVYCTLCVLGGLHLWTQYRWTAEDMLYLLTAEHQVFFCMAIAHWTVCVFEDFRCLQYLGAGMDVKQLSAGSTNAAAALNVVTPNEKAFSECLVLPYLLHHFMAVASFAAVMGLQLCSGLGVCGLIFELPVLLMNYREFVVCQEPRPAWYCNERRLNRFWRALGATFLISRAGATILYLYAVFDWADTLSSLAVSESIVFHLSAVFFTILNICLAYYLVAWRRSDIQYARKCLTVHPAVPDASAAAGAVAVSAANAGGSSATDAPCKAATVTPADAAADAEAARPEPVEVKVVRGSTDERE